MVDAVSRCPRLDPGAGGAPWMGEDVFWSATDMPVCSTYEPSSDEPSHTGVLHMCTVPS
jgi:hypothetical protein